MFRIILLCAIFFAGALALPGQIASFEWTSMFGQSGVVIPPATLMQAHQVKQMEIFVLDDDHPGCQQATDQQSPIAIIQFDTEGNDTHLSYFKSEHHTLLFEYTYRKGHRKSFAVQTTDYEGSYDTIHSRTETHYSYDKRKNLTGVSIQNQNGEEIAHFSYSYDKSGRMDGYFEVMNGFEKFGVVTTDPQGKVTAVDYGPEIGLTERYGYNESGNLISYIQEIANRSGVEMLVQKAEYDAADRLLKKTVRTGSAYNDFGELTLIYGDDHPLPCGAKVVEDDTLQVEFRYEFYE